MAKKKNKQLHPDQQAAREAEILNAPPDTSHRAVQALMSPEFATMSNVEAAQIALLLQEIVRGQNSLLANYEQTNLQIAKIIERQDRIDQELEQRLEEQRKYIDSVIERAEKLQRTGEDKERLVAKGAAMYQKAIQNARANAIVNEMVRKQRLASEPKVTVVSPGQLVTTIEYGQQVTKIVPEEVHIGSLRFVLPPGKAVEVPESVAKYLENRRRSQQETMQRQELLSQNLEAKELAEKWNKIGAGTEQMTVA